MSVLQSGALLPRYLHYDSDNSTKMNMYAQSSLYPFRNTGYEGLKIRKMIHQSFSPGLSQ